MTGTLSATAKSCVLLAAMACFVGAGHAATWAGQSAAPQLKRAPGEAATGKQPSQQTAAELDREAAERRAAERARQPEVAPGLRLPDESGVWALDTYDGTPELVRMRQSDGDLNLDTRHSVKAMPIPQGGAHDLIRLIGERSVVELHSRRPAFYVALDVPDEPAAAGAMTVDTHGAAHAMVDTTERASAASRYVVVRLRHMHGERAASAQELRKLAETLDDRGEAQGKPDLIRTESEALPGGRWLRVAPQADLNDDQYSLVELPGARVFNTDGWAFGVDSHGPENKSARLPKQH